MLSGKQSSWSPEDGNTGRTPFRLGTLAWLAPDHPAMALPVLAPTFRGLALPGLHVALPHTGRRSNV